MLGAFRHAPLLALDELPASYHHPPPPTFCFKHTQQTTDYDLKFLWFYSFVAATAVFIGVVHLRVSHRIHRDFKSLSNKSYKKDLIHINNKVPIDRSTHGQHLAETRYR